MSSSFTFDRGLSRTSWKEPALAIEFDQLRADRKSGDLIGEISVQLSGHAVHQARLNLLSTQTKSALAKHLATRTRGLSVDWITHIEDACAQTIVAFRAGEPSILLRDAERPPDAGWLLRPLIIGRHPTVLFGDGGALKSYLALAALADIHCGSSLLGMTAPARHRGAYLDWEFDAWEHKGRLHRLMPDAAELPDIVYVPCVGPLRDQVERLQRIIRERAIEYVVIDSVGLACEGPPEESQSAIGFFEALRRLDVGALCVAHVNRAGDTERSFGSAYWHNSARATWYVKKQQETAANGLDVGLFNRKSNTSALASPLGFRFTFDELRTTIERKDVRDVPALATEVRLRDRIVRALKGGALSYVELGERLDQNVDTIRITVTRHEGKLFTRVTNTPDGVHRVGLLRAEPNTSPERSPNSSPNNRTEHRGVSLKTPVFGAPSGANQ